MNFLNDLRIGTRIGAGFAIVLLLSILSSSIALMHARQAADATHAMLDGPLAKERIVSDWYVLIYSAIARTSLIAKSTDETLSKTFATEIALSAKRGGELQKSLEPMLASDAEKAMYAQITTLRAAYQAVKEKTMKVRSTGDAALAASVFESSFVPAAAAYQTQVLDFLKLQRRAIDEAGRANDDAYRNSASIVLTLSVLLVALGVVCAWLIARSITRPLRAAVDVATRVAQGDLSQQITVASRDEIGELMQALQAMNASLVTIIGQVQTGSSTMASASSEIASGNLDLSSRTEQQAGSLEKTAATMEQLTSTVKHNADNARQANSLAQTASQTAVKGGAAVAQVVKTMASINDSAKKIVDIIGVIDGIAFQTNILALNAAVEAARAGEQGRGFAVVASEVRNLAQRSAGAAKEIKSLISDSVSKVDAGSKLVNDAGVTMKEIVGSVRRVTDIMAEITSASDEQRTGIEQVNQAIVEMDNVTQQNAALVEEAAAAAGSLQDQAAHLAQVVSVFRLAGGANATAAKRRSVAAPRSPALLD
ncbi:MAG: HAMP domain-containing protein [Herminiimonas sp.]|nr:HAMP domain-containing protein [Herminiimonas sp.]